MKGFRILICALVVVLALVSAQAQERRTPVEVKNSPTVQIDATANTVKIDGTTNTVNALQSGIWTVGVNSMPTLNVNTHAVTQSGVWNAGITSMPAVSIDAAGNTVKAPTQSSIVQLWTSDQSIPNGGTLYSSEISCSGYKEIRVFLDGGVSSANVTATIRFVAPGPGGGYRPFGKANFAAPANALTNQANFIADTGTCAFTIPVMSSSFNLFVSNNSGGTFDIYDSSWVYLVN